MQFFPTPHQAELSTLSHFYWLRSEGAGKKSFQLYQENQRLASLHLSETEKPLASIETPLDQFHFKDSSSFFRQHLLLINTRNKQPTARIIKSEQQAEQGSLLLQGQTYSWKLSSRYGNRLVFMDAHRSGIFSYHYSGDMVRLMLTKSSRTLQHPELLLSIGLYLLPLWHR